MTYHNSGKSAWISPDDRVNWSDIAQRRLLWLYGIERAVDIALGKDAETNADLSAWNRLGHK